MGSFIAMFSVRIRQCGWELGWRAPNLVRVLGSEVNGFRNDGVRLPGAVLLRARARADLARRAGAAVRVERADEARALTAHWRASRSFCRWWVGRSRVSRSASASPPMAAR